MVSVEAFSHASKRQATAGWQDERRSLATFSAADAACCLP